MSEAANEWVNLSDWKSDDPLLQVVTAMTIWPKLTRKQRQLVAACRELRDPNAEWPRKYRILIDHLKGQPGATLRSLERKGVVDENGRLTIPGIYTALWNRLGK